MCYVGLDLWQVKSGTIFDNFLITDDAAEAKKVGEETWGAIKEGESKMKSEQDEEQRKKDEEAAKAAGDDEDKDDEEPEDDLDVDLGEDEDDSKPDHEEL